MYCILYNIHTSSYIVNVDTEY